MQTYMQLVYDKILTTHSQICDKIRQPPSLLLNCTPCQGQNKKRHLFGLKN